MIMIVTTILIHIVIVTIQLTICKHTTNIQITHNHTNNNNNNNNVADPQETPITIYCVRSGGGSGL